jgi:hypothetical protein
MSVAEIFHAAQAHGWCSATFDFDAFASDAKGLGLVEVPSRRGRSGPDYLRPTAEEDAHPRSLSAAYGLGPLPLHTDGAHLAVPPEFVVLSAVTPSHTPTLLWRPPTDRESIDRFRRGVFVVTGGRRTFLSTASSNGCVRYDPGCMRPCDQPARELAAAISRSAHEAHLHSWLCDDTVLVIDNRQVLHARASAIHDATDRVVRRLAYQRAEA